MNNLVDRIDAVLPQTQCGECGYAGCMPYAKALAKANTTIDRCPPGGVTTLRLLADLLNLDPEPFEAKLLNNTRLPALASIREAECIGCTKCIQACPVDAIIGSAKQMHTIFSNECTGCGLCIAPCPVDCIDLTTLKQAQFDPAIARQRFNTRQNRLALQKIHDHDQHQQAKASTADKNADQQAKQSYIQQALARVQAKQDKPHE